MAGRPKKSDALKAQQGTLRKSRINKNEIRVEALKKMPEPPKHFGQEIKEIWYNSGNELIDKGVLTTIDLPAFSRYCQHYHFYNLHTEYLNDESTTAQDYYKILSISKYLTDFETDFGLNPRGRANMNIVNKVVISPLKAKIEASRLKKVS